MDIIDSKQQHNSSSSNTTNTANISSVSASASASVSTTTTTLITKQQLQQTDSANTNSINSNSKLDLEFKNINNNANNNSHSVLSRNRSNSTPTKQLLLTELELNTNTDTNTDTDSIVAKNRNNSSGGIKSSELRLSELNSSDISTDSSLSSASTSTNSALFSSLPSASSFSSLYQQQPQRLQRSLNRRSFDPTTLSSLNLIHSGATTPPSKLARTLSSIVYLSSKKKENSRNSFPGLHQQNPYSPSNSTSGIIIPKPKDTVAIPLDINSLANSIPTSSTTASYPKSNSSVSRQPTTPINTATFRASDDNIDQISPHFTRRPSSLIVGAFPDMTPQQLDYEPSGRTTPDEELSEQNKFYHRIEQNPDGYITVEEIRSILSCYDNDAIDQIIGGIPFEGGICSNRIFLQLVQEFQSSIYDDGDLIFTADDDYDVNTDTKNHPINNLMDFQVDNKSMVASTEANGSSVDSPSSHGTGFVQKPRRFDLSVPPSYGEFVDNGQVNGAGISSQEYLELQSELSRLRGESNQREIEMRKRMKLEEDLQRLQSEITTKEDENIKLRKENQTLNKIDKKHKELSHELEKSKERENKDKSEIDKLKKRNQRNDEELKKVKNEQDLLQQKEEDALKMIEEKDTDIKKLRREYQKLENLIKELEESYQLVSQQNLELKQKEELYIVQQQSDTVAQNSLLMSMDSRPNLMQSQLHDQRKFQQDEDQINDLKAKIDMLEIERSSINDENQQLLKKLQEKQLSQQAIDDFSSKIKTLQSLFSNSEFAFVEQINHSQQFASQMIGSIDHLSQSITANKQVSASNTEVDLVLKMLKSKLPKLPEDLGGKNESSQQYQDATLKLDDTMKQLNEKWKLLHDNLVQWKKVKQMENMQQRQELEESKKIIKQLLTKQSEAQLDNNQVIESAIIYEKPKSSLWFSQSKHFFAMVGLVMFLYIILSILISYTIPPQPYFRPT